MTDLAHLSGQTALVIGEALAGGKATPVELADYLLEQIDQQTSPVFLNVTRERALREAAAAGERLKAGKPLSRLDGVPIAWKDLIDLQGEITTAGSDFYRNKEPAAQDAPIVANAAAAGMVSVGKLNLTEFAYSGLGLNPHFGTPVNSHSGERPRAPGGSSSGSGTAVCSGLVPCAIGTDTGGSVRVPAAFNGIVGYKPSEKRIDSTGIFALSRTLDTVGPLGRSVADCAALDAVLRRSDDRVSKTLSVQGLRFFVPKGVTLDDLDQAVAENFEGSVRALERAGATIVRAPLPPFENIMRLTNEIGTITAFDAYREHKALMESSAVSRIDRRVVARILAGKAISDFGLEILMRARHEGMRDVYETLDGAFLLMPTTPHVAPEIAPLEADDEVFHRINLKTLRNTALGNFLNLPGLALPNGMDAAGMPTSLLVSTTGGDDERLLVAGIEIEKTVRAAS